MADPTCLIRGIHRPARRRRPKPDLPPAVRISPPTVASPHAWFAVRG